MNAFSVNSISMIDLGIVAAYLLASLILGIRAGRKTQTMKDYAVANQTYDTPVIVCTLLATMIGASSTIGVIEKVYTVGLIWIIHSLVVTLKWLMVSEWIAPRMQPFLNMLSTGDIMGELYGRKGKLITGIATIGISLGYLAIQATAIGYVFQYYLNLSPVIGSIVGWSILLVYSAQGGMRAVTVTDVLQFAVLMVGIPFLCLFALNAVGGPIGLYMKLPESHCTLLSGGEGLNHCWTLWTIALIPMLNPAAFQRLLMLKDARRIRGAVRANVFLNIPLMIVIGLIGLTSVVLYPKIDTKFIVPTMIQDLLPVGMKGFVIAGILAVIMSTADSVLHVASLGLVRDVLGALRPKKLEDRTELLLSRVTTLVVGSVALLISINCKDIKALGFVSLHAWSPVVLLPLIAGIFGLRTKPITFILSVIAGFGTAVVWKFKIQPATGIDSLLPAIAANAITFYATHCVLHPGTVTRWVVSLWDRIRWRPGYHAYGRYPTPWGERFITSLKNINNFCKEKTDTNGIPYALFGLFVGTAYLGPYLMWIGDAVSDSPAFMTLRFAACLLCVPLALKDSWPKRLKEYVHIYWYFALWFCLPTVSTFMLLAGNGGMFGWLNIVMSFMALLAVLDCVSFIFLSSLGIAAAMGLANAFCIHFSSALTPENAYTIGYCYFFGAFAALLFIRSKEYIERRRQHNLKQIAVAVAQNIRQNVGKVENDFFGVDQFRMTLTPAALEANPNITEYLNTVESRFREIYHGVGRTLKVVKDSAAAQADISDESLWTGFELKPQLLHNIINKAITAYGISNTELARIQFDIPCTAHIRADEGLLTSVIGNLIQNALASIKASGKRDANVSITLIPNLFDPRLVIWDTGAGIDPKDLPNVFHQYNPETYTNGGLGLAFCKKAMTKMLGKIEIYSQLGVFTEVVLTFKGIRPFEYLAWRKPEDTKSYEDITEDSNEDVYWKLPKSLVESAEADHPEVEEKANSDTSGAINQKEALISS